MDFIKLFNVVSDVARPAHVGENPAKTMKDTLSDIGIDSLDTLVLSMYLCELFGIPDDDKTKAWRPVSVQDFFDYLMLRKTQQPESIEAALAAIK